MLWLLCYALAMCPLEKYNGHMAGLDDQGGTLDARCPLQRYKSYDSRQHRDVFALWVQHPCILTICIGKVEAFLLRCQRRTTSSTIGRSSSGLGLCC